MPTNHLRGIYAITPTPPSDVTNPDTWLYEKTQALLQGGVRILQYRDKSNNTDKRMRQAQHLRDICSTYGATFLINDDIHLAHAVSAHGVHLGQGDGCLIKARDLLGEQAIIGATCHNDVDLAIKAQAQGANYVAFGAMFASSTKPEAIIASPSIVKKARQHIQRPICVIGGITTNNAPDLMQKAQPDMLAIITDLYAHTDPYRQAQQFCSLFNTQTV